MTDAPKPGLGHGHVIPRPDGVKARCGGPAICRKCQLEKALLDMIAGDARAKLEQVADSAAGEPIDERYHIKPATLRAEIASIRYLAGEITLRMPDDAEVPQEFESGLVAEVRIVGTAPDRAPHPEITDAERLNKLTTIRRALDVFRDAEIARLVRLDSPDKAVTMYGVARIAALGNLEDIAVATAWIDAAIREERSRNG